MNLNFCYRIVYFQIIFNNNSYMKFMINFRLKSLSLTRVSELPIIIQTFGRRKRIIYVNTQNAHTSPQYGW